MGRRSGGGFGGSRRSSGSSGGFFGRRAAPKPKPKEAPKAAPRAAPRPAASSSASSGQSSGGGVLGSLGQTLMQGMVFGAGSAVAHRAVDAVAGPRTIKHEWEGEHPPQAAHDSGAPAVGAASAATSQEQVCMIEKQDFAQCITDNQGDVSACQFYFDALSSCQQVMKPQFQ